MTSEEVSGDGKKAFVSHPLLVDGAVEDRLYQQVILGTCAVRNTLVILPTALGKTVVSLLVAVLRLTRYPWGKILVLAPTVPLATQHRESFRRFLNSDVPDGAISLVTGKVPQAKREHLWDASRLVFATPQTVRNDLRKGRYDLSTVSLVVFDEAHRARSNYAYTEIARRYLEDCPDPLVLALTASPGSTRERIGELCEALSVEAIEFRSDADPDVAPYVHSIERRWHEVELSDEYRRIRALLRSLLDDRIRQLQSMELLPRGGRSGRVSKTKLLELGRELHRRVAEGAKGSIYWIIGLQSSAVSLMHAIEVLTTQDISVLLRFLRGMEGKESRTAKKLCGEPRFREALALAQRDRAHPHPKLASLSLLVGDELERDGEARLIVFTQYRDTVDRIMSTLSAVPGARPVRFVGQAKKADSPGLSQKEQSRIIGEFRDGVHNVLVATCIAEEGLDIPSVSNVIFYEPIPSEIRLIQRRGRTGRKQAGAVDILITRDTLDEVFYWASRSREKRMKGIVSNLNRGLSQDIERTRIPEPPGWEERAAEARARLGHRKRTKRKAPKPQRSPPEPGACTPPAIDPASAPGRVARWIVSHIGRQGGYVELEDLLAAAEVEGMPNHSVEEALERLVAEGVLYRPSPSRVGTV
jgi:Fanconi anemia group M protein